MPRPNILFIMTDDQTARDMSCYGNPILATPNMDRLAREGTRFTRCFCTNALCAPSRATVLTGSFSHVHGIYGNSEKADAVEELNPQVPTFPELLQQAGYRTGLVGKYHIRQEPRGFDHWVIHPGQGCISIPSTSRTAKRCRNRDMPPISPPTWPSTSCARATARSPSAWSTSSKRRTDPSPRRRATVTSTPM